MKILLVILIFEPYNILHYIIPYTSYPTNVWPTSTPNIHKSKLHIENSSGEFNKSFLLQTM
jgi:hypothetical protein